jgi:hypothetical protein
VNTNNCDEFVPLKDEDKKNILAEANIVETEGRRIFYIDCKDVPNIKAEEFIEILKEKFAKRKKDEVL